MIRSKLILNAVIRSKLRLMHRPLMMQYRALSSDKDASRSTPPDGQKETSGFNIFEQLKAQKSGQKSEDFEDPADMDEKAREKLNREAAKAEKDVNERQKKTFGYGSLSFLASSLGLYIFLGISVLVISGLPNDDKEENSFNAHNRRFADALKSYYNVSNPYADIEVLDESCDTQVIARSSSCPLSATANSLC